MYDLSFGNKTCKMFKVFCLGKHSQYPDLLPLHQGSHSNEIACINFNCEDGLWTWYSLASPIPLQTFHSANVIEQLLNFTYVNQQNGHR
jgi:hypothetical protein